MAENTKKVFTDESLATFVEEIKKYTNNSIDDFSTTVAYIDATDNENVVDDNPAANIIVDSALSTTSTNPVQNKVITNKFTQLSEDMNNLGGTVEVTSGNPEKDNTVLVINPNSDTLNIYSVEEVDEMINGLSEEIDDEKEAREQAIEELKVSQSQIEAPKIVSSVDEMTDTTKHYVNQTTGTIWAYMKYEKVTEGSTVANFTNVFDADKAMIGYRWSNSSKAPTVAEQCILSDYIPCDLSSGEHIVRIKNGRLDWNASNAGIAYFTSNIDSSAFAIAHNLDNTPIEEEDGVLAYKLGEKSGSMISGYDDTRYIRCIAIQMKDSNYITPQTLENARNIIITIDEPITYTNVSESTEIYYEWADTGISYSPTFDTDLIGVLGENNVVYISDNLPSGIYTLKYGNETYETIGTITVE